jgi:hypothetical protein
MPALVVSIRTLVEVVCWTRQVPAAVAPAAFGAEHSVGIDVIVGAQGG